MNVCPECGATTNATSCSKDGCPTLDPALLESPERGDIGSLVAEKYRVLNVVGRGGMGVVYRAWQRDMHRLVALKVANGQSMDEAGARRFLREVRVVAGLTHPNTVRVFDYGRLPDGRLFFTMEFLDGQSLSRLIRRKEPFDDRRILRIGIQVLKSLGEAHAAGIVHRDLSPDNIFLCRMFGEADFVKVLDFGVAKGMAFEAGEEKLTVAGVFVGKPAYASPEQVEGSVELDGRSDLYSLGIVLYQMCTGQVPFQSTTPMKVLIAHLRERPRDVQEAAQRPIHPDLARLVMRLLSKNREDRPRDAGEALEEMQRIEDQFVRTPSPESVAFRTVASSTGRFPGRSPSRRWKAWAIGALLALLLGGLGAVALVSLGERRDASPPGESAPAVQHPESPVTAPAPNTEAPVSPALREAPEVPPVASPKGGETATRTAPDVQSAPASKAETEERTPRTSGPSEAVGRRPKAPTKAPAERGERGGRTPSRTGEPSREKGGWTF